MKFNPSFPVISLLASLVLVALPTGAAAKEKVLWHDLTDQSGGAAGRAWHTYAGTNLSIDRGVLTVTDATGSGGARSAEVAFPPTSLAVGEEITVSLSLRINSMPTDDGGVRIGLYQAGKDALRQDSSAPVDSISDRTGYFLVLDTRNYEATGTAPLRYTGPDQSPFMIAEGNGRGNFKNLHKFGSEWAAVVWTIKRTSEKELEQSLAVNEGVPQELTCAAQSDTTGAFDTFMVFSKGGASFSVRDLEIKATTTK